MLQRLGLAQAMLHDPDIFILDEPTDGLDPLARSQVRGYLAELKQQGKTVFLNSHILQEVELICDRVAILDKGTLRRVAKVKEITKSGGSELAGTAPLLEVHLDLAGNVPLIRSLLPAEARLELHGENSVRAVIQLPDQSSIDALVDELRRQQVSIVSLARGRLSLEQAYLEIVAAEPIGE
jgi:ABC-2 type transport system ATP-binding protein